MRQNSHKMNNNNQTYWILGHQVSLHPTSGNYDLAIFETPPESQGPPPHTHHKYEEAFVILEGEMEFFIDGKTHMVKAGESVDVPPGTLHTFHNRSKQPCKWINIHSPKGFSEFFKSFGIPCTEQDALKRSVHSELIQKVLTTASDFDMLIPPSP